MKGNASQLSEGQDLWRGGLPPFGCEAVANPVRAVCLAE
ncbi:hypothetical protein SAMN04490191_6120 [Pseudomonas lini]|uniref:Uncharacterized protein n=1 Tax=Pseudomonas lini TaxID=163011 RepID=A0A1H2C9R7_9PSED|nr:hypothetical protein SAMN04490191_6120 [Pseudomonas lini]